MKKFTVYFLIPSVSWEDIKARNADDAIKQCHVEPHFEVSQFVAIEQATADDSFACPHCQGKIDRVNVYSQCMQRGDLDGDKITDYNEPEVLDTQGIECPLCAGDLIEHIKNA